MLRFHRVVRRGFCVWFFGCCLVPAWLTAIAHGAEWQVVPAGESALDNPLKGLVPYANPEPGRFPHSLEFSYLPVSALVTGRQQYDWQPLEKLLDDIASRGHQAVLRFYLEYPNRRDGVPQYLLRAGLKMHRYLNTNTAPLPPAPIATPDYEDPRLRELLVQFIEALGQRYDGDPRLGYLTAGLLGTWGEWHTYPRENLFASKQVQAEVLDAYERAFKTTPVLLRYPAGPENEQYTSTIERPFGYHDDSFAWATRITGREDDSWFYLALLQDAGEEAGTIWKQHPIGGEIRPEVWGCVFDEPSCAPEGQEIGPCVEETHVTWLMDTGLFREQASPERQARAAQIVRRMGYDLSVQDVLLEPASGANDGPRLSVRVTNRGVAPWYPSWPVELAWLNRAQRTVVLSAPVDWSLAGLQPEEVREFSAALPQPAGVPTADLVPALRVVQPLKNGNRLRFANQWQDAHVAGWLSLAE